MRSNSENIDVSYICKIFGGGGHKKASSFMENEDFITNIRVKPINIANDIKILIVIIIILII